jgi:hypothetical protein
MKDTVKKLNDRLGTMMVNHERERDDIVAKALKAERQVK